MKCLPSSASNGVYIYPSDGYLYHPELWDYYVANDITKGGIKGVALITNNCRFFIAHAIYNSIKWANLGPVSVDSQVDIEKYKQHYNGQEYTDMIINKWGQPRNTTIDSSPTNTNTDMYAAYFCRKLPLFNNGYLGSMGEMYELYQNIDIINFAFAEWGIRDTLVSGQNFWTSNELGIQ